MEIAVPIGSFCPNFMLSPLTYRLSSASIKFYRLPMKHCRMICKASSASGSPHASSDENPYKVLGVSPMEGFENMKTAYSRRRKDAERRGDEASIEKLDWAYDKIMMMQLTNRKKGVTFGQFQVSKDIKYADKMPIIPWGPRPSRSSVNDIRINMAISAVFTIWILVQRNADWKPLQFLAFAFFYRVFEKLKASEPDVNPVYNEYGEDEGRGLRMGKRVLRSLFLVFGCMSLSSLGYTGVLNLIEYARGYIPVLLYNNQELIVTTVTAVMLFFTASYYR